MANEKIKEELKKNRFTMWQLADIEGCCAETISRKLRHELSNKEQKRLISLIRKYSDKDLSNETICPYCGIKLNTRRTKK